MKFRHLCTHGVCRHLFTGWRWHPAHLAAIVSGLSLCAGLAAHHRSAPNAPPPANAADSRSPVRLPLATPSPPGLLFTAPTPQHRWTAIDDPDVYMPTGSGRVVSAAYGSTRTDSRGRARFHEGVDIGPTSWRAGRAEDDIFAMAHGTVAYIQRSAGGSSYGIYVVLDHADPVGTLYTLYAHLASVPPSLKEGQSIRRGQVIGKMGHSSSLGIPRQRSHLHLEIGLRLNSRFSEMYRARGRSNPHGDNHGHNLFGFDSRRVLFSLEDRDPTRFSALASLQREVPAWRIVIRTSKKPDFFHRHPKLWTSDGNTSFQAIVVDVHESGLPLWGRPARGGEIAELETKPYHIAGVNQTVLGRNGRRHVIKQGDTWVLGSSGDAWRTLLLHGAR